MIQGSLEFTCSYHLCPQALFVIDHKSHMVVRYLLCVPVQFNRHHRHIHNYSGCKYDKQTDRHTYIHTHVRNAVTLVWGSLRLTPNYYYYYFLVYVVPYILNTVI